MCPFYIQIRLEQSNRNRDRNRDRIMSRIVKYDNDNDDENENENDNDREEREGASSFGHPISASQRPTAVTQRPGTRRPLPQNVSRRRLFFLSLVLDLSFLEAPCSN